MAEEMTSDVAPAESSHMDSGSDAGQSSERVQSASTEPQPQTDSTTASAQDKPKKVNLYELDEFRQYQSQMTRAQQQREQQLQAQLYQYEQRMQQLEDSNLDDYDRAQRRAERAEQRLIAFQQQIAQQYQQQEANQRIYEDLQRIHDRTGIPVEELAAANPATYDDAWDVGIAYMKKQGATQAEQNEAQREANRTVVGGGKASTPSTRKERELDRAMAEGDPVAYIRNLRMTD